MTKNDNKYDHLYLINQPKSRERLQSMTEQLDAADIEFEVFSARSGLGVEVYNTENKQSHRGQWYHENKEV